jgi:hypothetical protein
LAYNISPTLARRKSTAYRTNLPAKVTRWTDNAYRGLLNRRTAFPSTVSLDISNGSARKPRWPDETIPFYIRTLWNLPVGLLSMPPPQIGARPQMLNGLTASVCQFPQPTSSFPDTLPIYSASRRALSTGPYPAKSAQTKFGQIHLLRVEYPPGADR